MLYSYMSFKEFIDKVTSWLQLHDFDHTYLHAAAASDWSHTFFTPKAFLFFSIEVAILLQLCKKHSMVLLPFISVINLLS